MLEIIADSLRKLLNMETGQVLLSKQLWERNSPPFFGFFSHVINDASTLQKKNLCARCSD